MALKMSELQFFSAFPKTGGLNVKRILPFALV